jgi:hypothetical protein
MDCTIIAGETPNQMYEAVRKLNVENKSAREKDRERIDKLQRTKVGVFPQKDEAHVDGDMFLPSPKCPRCNNQDPRAFLDDATIVNLGGIPSGYCVSIVPVQTYVCSQTVECLACSMVFAFAPSGNVFNPTGATNMGKSSRAFVARIVAPEPPEPPVA